MKYSFSCANLEIKTLFGILLLLFGFSQNGYGQQRSIYDRLKSYEQTLDISSRRNFVSEQFSLDLLSSSQLAVGLKPKSDPEFDFLPSEILEIRSRDSLYHLGDINLMIRESTGETWEGYSSAHARNKVIPLPLEEDEFAASLINPTLGENFPLEVKRSWKLDNGQLVLSFIVKNSSESIYEIGYLGVPMVFDNILHEKNLDEAHLEKVFYDPYVGLDAGYLQVVRLSGNSPVLVVLPQENAQFEAYSPLLDDRTPRGITFEGFHEWVIHSKAKALTDWKSANQWNEPTSRFIEPGESYEVSLKFVLTEGLRNIENLLKAQMRPLAVGLPGYILPQDVNAKLFISNHKKIENISVFPKDAIQLKKIGLTNSGEWNEYEVRGNLWGRARVEVNYSSGEVQTIHYKVIKPESQVVSDLGRFLTTEQWYENPSDLFGRDQSVISYDIEKREKIVHDNRAWIAGLSDEGGAGSWLAAIMKQFLNPDPEEMKKLNKFYYETLWGGIQFNDGEKKYGVRKSMYYYAPDSLPKGTYDESINYNTWSAWSKKEAESTGRSYNYPHVAAAHWVMYRLSRFHEGLAETHPWNWYLDNAFKTSVAMVEQAPHYAQFGQMEGSVFLFILQDLRREGMVSEADHLENLMRQRTDVWVKLSYPFGSEMPWDSTGQEEVYMWTDYFGFQEKANVTLNAILAYMPSIPHWGYNGSARRYWDFLYGGKIRRVERQLHHYGSALNSIPVLDAYHKNPNDFYLLRVGYGGVLGGISNITPEGFASAAFHSFPSTLEIDGLSGDYGSGFYGYSVNSRTYLVKHEDFGWVGFGGNVEEKDDWITITPTTAGKNSVYIQESALLIQLDAGRIQSARFNTSNGSLELILEPISNISKMAAFRILNFNSNREYKPENSLDKIGDRYWLNLEEKVVKITLKP